MKGLRCARAAETGNGGVLSVGAWDVPLACRAQRHGCGGETLRRTCGRGANREQTAGGGVRFRHKATPVGESVNRGVPV